MPAYFPVPVVYLRTTLTLTRRQGVLEQFPTELNSSTPLSPVSLRAERSNPRLEAAHPPRIASSRDALLAMTSFSLIRINELNPIGNRSEAPGAPRAPRD